jgi:CDP-diacylglycerol---glycerol-3-phosphate 3-phosphatidyltransferase
VPTPRESNATPSIWNPANALTLVRLLLVPVFGWLLLRAGGDHDPSRIAAFAVFSVALVTDRLDGELARRRDMITDLGKIADPIADKALTGMAFIGLSVLGLLPWWVTLVVLGRELGITALRFAIIRYGVMPASRGGKVKTALQGLALGLYILPLPTGWEPVQVSAMALAVAVTVLTGIDYVLQAIRLRRSARSETS